MTGREEFHKLLKERAAGVLPPGETLLDSHVMDAAESMPRPRRKLCPVVFPGQRMAGDRPVTWLMSVLAITALVQGFAPIDDLYDRLERDGAKDKPFFGGWRSAAGRMALPFFPRAKTGVAKVMLVTERRFLLVHVQHSLIGKRIGSHVAVAWSADRRETSWVRNRRDVRPGTYEIGFADGSWATVFIGAQGWSRFERAFGRQLGPADPLP
ncbi:hypothetical protein ACWC2K_08785 [Streptomyces chattanoogensis]